MKFNYKILHNYGNFLAVLKEIIFNVCEVREMSNDQKNFLVANNAHIDNTPNAVLSAES